MSTIKIYQSQGLTKEFLVHLAILYHKNLHNEQEERVNTWSLCRFLARFINHEIKIKVMSVISDTMKGYAFVKPHVSNNPSFFHDRHAVRNEFNLTVINGLSCR